MARKDYTLSKGEINQTFVDQVMADFERAKADLTQWSESFERVFQYTIPERHSEYSNHPDRLYDRIWDSTAVEATHNLSNTLTSGLTPVWTPWFQLVPGPMITDRKERSEYRKSLHIVNQILFIHLNLSNFVPQIQSTFLDMTVSTGAISVEGHKRGVGLEFSNIPIEQLSILRNRAGEITHLFREYEYSAADILMNEDYLKKLPEQARRDLERDITKKCCVVEALVLANDMKTWLYMVILKRNDDQGRADHVLLEEKEFKRQTIKVGRWSTVPGHAYGRGPGLLTYGDIRMLNKVKELGMKNLAKAVSGSYTVRDDGVVNPRNIILRSGTLIPVGSNDSSNPTIRELPRSGQMELMQYGIGDLRESIRKAYLADQFSPTVGTKMSAMEIAERGRAISQSLGSTYANIQHDILIPLVKDSLDILQEQGQIEVDFTIDREEIDIMFLSSIANAQRLSEVDAMMQFAQVTQQLMELDPRSAVVLNAEEFQRKAAELLAIDESLLRDEDEVRETTEDGIEAMAMANGIAPQQPVPEGDAGGEIIPQ